MIEDKAFQTLLRMYLNEAKQAHAEETVIHGDYSFLIERREADEDSDQGTLFVMKMFETGSDKFKITMEASREEFGGGCCGDRDFYINGPVVEHAGKGDPCQDRMAQMFLKKAAIPFTLYIYHALGIKA